MEIWFAILQMLTQALILAVLCRPLGDYMAKVYALRRDLKVEHGFYRLSGWMLVPSGPGRSYSRSVLAFSAIGVLLVYAIQRAQAVLPYSLGFPAIPDGPVVQHVGIVCGEHELAVVFAGCDDGLFGGAGGPGGAEFRLRRCGNRGRG